MIVNIKKYRQEKNKSGTIQNFLIEERQFTNEADLLKYYEQEIKRIHLNKLKEAERDAEDYIRLSLTGKIK